MNAIADSGIDKLRVTSDRHIFHRDLQRQYKVAVSGQGASFRDEEGAVYLDGSSGSFVCCLGHGVEPVISAVSKQAMEIAFTNTRNFTSEPELRLAERLAKLSPMANSRLWLCSSGTAANEAAVKMTYQYHALRGNPQKTEIVARWRSYHGSSVAALSLTGDYHKRAAFETILTPRPHVEPPFCLRCPWGQERASCTMQCADALEAEILRVGPERVGAVITEPFSGAPLGAMQVPTGYFERVREICDRHDLLMIVDEVISGMGRTGAWFATSHFEAIPDIITLGKGLAAGMSPVGAVLVGEGVFNTFNSKRQNFTHYETFTGHALSAAAADAVLAYIDEHELVGRVADVGRWLGEQLQSLKDIPIVGDVRGAGFLWGIEIVRGDGTLVPFASEKRAADVVLEIALNRGLLLMAGRGAADGILGDTLVLSPPYVATKEELMAMVDILRASLSQASSLLAVREDTACN